MTSEQKTALSAEIRTDFQIPPYQSDDTIGRAIDKIYARLSHLYGADFNTDSDMQGKMLLENGVYYELYHRYEEFEPAYQGEILSWQLGGPVAEEDGDGE